MEVLLFILVEGYCIGLYIYDTLSIDILKQLQEQNATKEMVGISTMFQYGILFGIILASIGIIISKKGNLWKKFTFNKEAFIRTLIVTVISAMLFAVGHIPSTISMTTLTPVLLVRCFLFNGGLRLCFGYLYRKYGIGYSMAAHGFAHLISDILMILFI